ncbi:MAG: metalloregulator ArsR/SmtB family transcription factor [Planctomycetota bacterium]
MALKSTKQYEARANIAKSLAHPSRLMLLDALKNGPTCVSDLTEFVGSDQSTVSKHLAILRQAGLVDVEKDGAMSYYRVNCPCLDDFFTCIENVLRRNLKAHQAAVARR